MLIQKYDSTSSVGIGRVQIGILYIRLSSSFKTQQSDAKLLCIKRLSYSIVEITPRIPLTLRMVEKIKCIKAKFVLLLVSFSGIQ